MQDIVVKDVTKTEPQPSVDGEDEELEITEQEEEIIEGECELCRGEGRIQCEACNGQLGFSSRNFSEALSRVKLLTNALNLSFNNLIFLIKSNSFEKPLHSRRIQCASIAKTESTRL